MVNMNGVAPATVKELTVSTIETLKMQYENYVRQNPVGQVQHPHVYLASEPRRMLASICRWLRKDDYSDWEKLRVGPTEWFKQVLLMLKKQFGSEKEEGNLTLKRNKGNHPMNSSHSDLGKRDIRQTERRYDQRDYRREDRKDHSRETYYRRNDSHRQNDRDKEKTDDRKTYYQRDFQKKVPYQNRRESSSEDRTKEVKETKKNDSK